MLVEISRSEKLPKLYLRGLEHAVKVGAVSVASLQKKLNVQRQVACDMLLWMIEDGFVKDEGGKDDLKTAIMREDEFYRMVEERGISLKTKREKQRTVEGPIYKACLRFAIRYGKITLQLLMSELALGSVRASAVLDKMCEEKFIEREFPFGWRVLITKEQFKEIYGEEV
jgi:hypothetical protein